MRGGAAGPQADPGTAGHPGDGGDAAGTQAGLTRDGQGRFIPLALAPIIVHISTRRNGAVAQLGERVVRNDEVSGSIPLSSTIPAFREIWRQLSPCARLRPPARASSAFAGLAATIREVNI